MSSKVPLVGPDEHLLTNGSIRMLQAEELVRRPPRRQ